MATDFLQAAGTNGFITTPFNLLSTELNALASTNTAESSVGGTSGVFSQTNTASAILGAVYFVSGGAFTPTTGGNIALWFLRSPDGGTTFEKVVSNVAVARAPDVVLNFMAQAHASADTVFANLGEVQLPFESFKVLIQNNTGVALPASGNLIKLGPVAIQY